MRKIILLIIIFITFSFSAFSTTNINYEKTKIKLIVFGPGDEIFTRWGHFGIVIDYPEKKDLLFDYGNFSFKENDFLKNFIKGIMKYSKEVAYADYVIRAYKRVNRSITTAELDLTPEQKKLFIDTLFFEIEPENKYYQYDQFKNNCVSEMNRLINEVTDGTFLKDTSDSTNRTFRETTRDYISSNHFYNLLIMLLLGTQMDRDITIEESLFLPDNALKQALKTVIPDGNGSFKPLVKDIEQIYVSHDRDPIIENSNANFTYALILGVIIALASLIINIIPIIRKIFPIIAGLSMSIVGSVLFFMAFFSGHYYIHDNWNLIYLSPLNIFIVIGAILKLHDKSRDIGTKIINWYINISLGLTAIIVLLKLFGLITQQNGEIMLIFIPLFLLHYLGRSTLFSVKPSKTVDAPSRASLDERITIDLSSK